MRSNNLFWGLILVAVGGLLLLSTLGILQGNVWNLIWPVFLIVLGVWILIGVTNRGRARPLDVERVEIPLEGASKAIIKIHHGAGRLVIGGSSTPGMLVSGNFTGGLDYSRHANGNGLNLDLKPRLDDRTFWGVPWGWNNRGYEWEMALSRETPLSLTLETGAQESKVDLSELCVTELRLSTGASDTEITLPANAGYTRVHLEAGAASVKVHVPGGVAAQIRSQSGLSSIRVDPTRFPGTGNVYASPDYATAANKTDIDIQVGVGSVSIS